MGEMVASRSMQVLDYLKEKHEFAHGLVEGEVKQLVATLEKIERLLNNEKLVKENVRNIRNLVYTIEDALETWAVGVEEAFTPSKNEEKRGITRLPRRCFGQGDEGSGNIFYVMLMFVMRYILEVRPLIDSFHATFPEDVLKSEIDTDRRAKKPIELSVAHGGSLALPRQMYAQGMQEHFVEMKEELEKLVELVSDQDEKHRVVSICGAKGLGKTSLARRVYIDPKVRDHFNAFAWVHLSQDYQIDGLLQSILNQLDAGVAVKKSADEKKANPSQIEAVKKSAEEHKKEGAEETIEGAEEMIEVVTEGAEMIEGAREHKDGTEKRGNHPHKSVMKKGAGAVKKSCAAEHKKGAEEMIEGAVDMIEVVTEDAEETIEGAREQKKGTVKRGNPLKSVIKKVAGALKKSSAAEHKKGAEQKEEGAEQKKEGAEEMIEDTDAMIEVVTEDAEETIEGAPEQKKDTEKRGNHPLKSVMKTGTGAVKKSSAAEHKNGAEQKKEGAEEIIEDADEMIEVVTEDAEETIEGAPEQKKGTEKRGNPLKSVMKTGAGAVKKSTAAEHKKGAEQKKEDAEEMIEDTDEMIEVVREDAEEMIEGAREQKKGKEKRGNPLKSVMKTGTGPVKKSSPAEHKKGAEEMIEDADEMIEVVIEDAEETIEGALEQKKGKEKRGNPLKSVMKTGAGAVKKSSAAEHKNGAEQKKEGAEEMIEDADEIIEVVTEDAEETIEGAREQKKGTEKRGNPLKSVMRKVAGAVKKSSAAEHEKGAEQKKEGAEEMIEGALEQKKGTEKRGNPLQIVMRISSGAGAVKKSSAAEHKKGAEQKKEGAEEQPKSMMDQLKKILREEKCFIVIDGISESSHWDYISSEFLIADTRFLLTTQKEEIAGKGFSHKLRCLNEDEGWELLRKYAFRGKKAPNLGLMPRLGKEMVGKCGYLPSAISILGRILSEKSSLSEWHKVNDDVKRYLQKEAEQSESNESVHNAWDPTCYDRLPYREKQCFFYLAIFKKDEGVDPEDLSFLWMAESMFSPEERTLLMEQTKNYVGEFASLLHVQVDELSTNRRFISLPDHMREYYLHMGVKEDFRLKVVDFSGGKQPRFDQYSLSDGIRRLVIHFNKLSSTEEPRYLKPTYNLRSLLFLNSDREYVHLPVTISDFKEFTLLRILHFVRCKFEGRKLPEGIWKLLNLRYFGLLYCDLDKLPPSITNFRNLQVLNVRSYEDSKIVIPNVISQMVSLKHVRLPSNSDHEQSDRLKLDGLRDLQTLDGLNADIHDPDSLSKLKNLRDLSTHAYSNGSLESIIEFVKNHGARIRTNLLIEHQCDFTSQEGMTVLEEVLMCPNLNALTFSMVVMPMFPNCKKDASEHLTQIKLIGCKLREDPMEALGKFPNLGKLWLAYGAFVGTTIAIGDDGGFPNLEYLEFRCLSNLEEWRVDEGAMKRLSTLIVRKCPKLKGIPDGLASVTSLNNMEIELPPTALAQGWEEIYKNKFGFVNSLSIRKLEIRSAGSSSAH